MLLVLKTILTLYVVLENTFCDDEVKPDIPTDEEYANLTNVDQDGPYKQQTFMVINTQFEGLDWKDACEDNYVKCLVSLMSSPTPVCAYHAKSYPTGQFTFPSYCDMFFDNCRRGIRHWRLLGYGVCTYSGLIGQYFDILPGNVKGNTSIQIDRRRLDDWWNLRHIENNCSPGNKRIDFRPLVMRDKVLSILKRFNVTSL